MLSFLLVYAFSLAPEKVNESKLSQTSQEAVQEFPEKSSFVVKNKIKEPSKNVKSRSVIIKQKIKKKKTKKKKKKKEKNIKEKIEQVMVDAFVKNEDPTPLFTGNIS